MPAESPPPHESSPRRAGLHLTLLGNTSLVGEGGSAIAGVLGAPKRLALLAYLVLAEPAGFHRRDTLVAMLWPQLDQARARGALRNALHLLRRDLGDGVLLSRGDEEVGVAAGALACDVLHLRAALRAGHSRRAVALYRGPLLPGFFVPGADPDFEEWLDGERRRLDLAVARAAEKMRGEQGTPAVALTPPDVPVGSYAAGRTSPQPAPSLAAATGSAPVAPAPASQGSVAVLPFENLSPDADTDYFADGMVEELIGRLARFPVLRVAARSSSFAFRGTGTPLREIAARLGVANLVEGSVRREGATVRIGVRVIEGATGFQRWGGSFERAMVGVFALQDEMATTIAAAIAEAMGGTPAVTAVTPRPAPTASLEAYDRYLAGLYRLQQRGVGPLRESIARFQGAIALDPAFALAHGALATAWQALTFWEPAESARAHREAAAAAERAVVLDPTIADAHAVLATVAIAQGGWQDAERRYRQAIALAPNQPLASHWYADFLQQVGRARASIDPARMALALDPVSPVRHVVLAVSYLLAGEREAARAHYDMAYRLGLARDSFLPLAFTMEGAAPDAPLGDLLVLDAGARASLPRSVGAALVLPVSECRSPAGQRLLGDALPGLIAHSGLLPHQCLLLALLAGDAHRALAEGQRLMQDASWFIAAFWLSDAAPVRALPAFAALTRAHGLDAYWAEYGVADCFSTAP